MYQIMVHGAGPALWEREPRKRRKLVEQLSGHVLCAVGTTGISRFCFAMLWQQKQELDKNVWEQPKSKNGVASPAVAGHSPLLYPSLALPLWREPRQKTFPSSGFADHSLANARLDLQRTRARLSQHFPCKRLLCSAIALSGRKSVLIWSWEVSKYAKLLNAVACYPRKTEE